MPRRTRLEKEKQAKVLEVRVKEMQRHLEKLVQVSEALSRQLGQLSLVRQDFNTQRHHARLDTELMIKTPQGLVCRCSFFSRCTLFFLSFCFCAGDQEGRALLSCWVLHWVVFRARAVPPCLYAPANDRVF